MRKAARSIARVAVALAAGGFSLLAPPPSAAQEVCAACCYRPQSPRSLTAADWNWTARTPTVTRINADSIAYEPRPGVRKVLHICSQHYHCRIENVQGCPGESAAPAAAPSDCPAVPPKDSWVEIHTVYHDGPALLNPTPQGIERCGPAPLVVVGYQAKVTTAAVRPPIPQFFGPPSAEWTGSATTVDPPPPAPPSCEPAAFWSFALGCDFKVSQEQLKPFTEPKGARVLQPANRLSHDLTHVVGRTKHPKQPPAKPQ